jgi:hypothetical protein
MGARAQTGPLFGDIERLLREQFGMIDEGFEAQRGELSLAGRTAKQGLLDRESQLRSQIESRNVGRGLSTVTQPLDTRGLHHQTSQGLTGIQENLGQMFAGLEGQRTQGRLGVQQQLAQIPMQRIGQEQRFFDMMAQTRESNFQGFPLAPTNVGGQGLGANFYGYGQTPTRSEPAPRRGLGLLLRNLFGQR